MIEQQSQRSASPTSAAHHTSGEENIMETINNQTVRYHVDCTMPVRPPMATAIHQAQLCSAGHYRQCVDVAVNRQRTFERWAEHNQAVIRY